MRSRGGETGGLTLMDAIRLYEERGYGAQFGTRAGGEVKCFTCGNASHPDDLEMRSMRRVEGVSDPADEALVAAVVCPRCDAHGVLTMMYGPMAPPEDNEALRHMRDAREALRQGVWNAPEFDSGAGPTGGDGPPGPP